MIAQYYQQHDHLVLAHKYCNKVFLIKNCEDKNEMF